MVRHRCTGCKEDVGQYGVRHKYAGGVFCEQCMRSFGIHRGRIRGFWGRLWDKIVDIIPIFHPAPARVEQKRREEKIRVHNKVMAARARTIPADPQSISAR